MFTRSNCRHAGVTLIELIVFIVIVSVGLAGVLASLNVSVKGSADPLQPKQAMAIAEGVIEEILFKDYCDPSLPGAVAFTANTTAGSVAISGITPPTTLVAGQQVIGSGLRGTALVEASPAPTSTTLTLSSAALTTATGVSLTAAACDAVEASRSLYDNVRDYHGYSANPASMLDGSTLSGYSFSVSVPSSTVTIDGVPMLQVTVNVTAPNGSTYSLTGYRGPF